MLTTSYLLFYARVQCTSKYDKRFNGDDRVPTLNAQCGNGRQLMSTLQLQCFNMAARLAVRSENKLELEKEGLSAKTLNLKPFACSGDYTGKPILSHTRCVSVIGR